MTRSVSRVSYATRDMPFGVIHADMAYRIALMQPGDVLDFDICHGYSPGGGAKIKAGNYSVERFVASIKELIKMHNLPVQMVPGEETITVQRMR